MGDRFRDPFGWLLDILPWRIRRLYFAVRFREWPWDIPHAVRIVGCRRPPDHVFDYFRKLYGADSRPTGGCPKCRHAFGHYPWCDDDPARGIAREAVERPEPTEEGERG